MDYLDISINHNEIVCCFIENLLEYKKNSLPKLFLLEIFKPVSALDPVFKKNPNPFQKKYPDIRFVPSSALRRC